MDLDLDLDLAGPQEWRNKMIYLGIIFLDVIIPILILLVIGAVLQKKFEFNLKAFSGLITYCFMPAAVFINIYETKIEYQVLLEIMGYLIIFTVIIMIVSSLLTKMLNLDKGEAAILKNSNLLMNAGNYGIPVSQLIFQANPLGISIQIIVLVFQTLLTYTYGLYNLISATKNGLQIIKSFLQMPIIYAIILGGVLNGLQIEFPEFIMIPIERLGDALIASALVLLGAQLSQIKMRTIFNKIIFVSSFGRLIIGPAITLILIYMMGLEGVVAQSLFIASAFPTSRNSATLALENDVYPNLAAQTVLFTTIVSSITVTIVVYLSSVLFG